MQSLVIKKFDTVEEAPTYHDKGYKVLVFKEAVIVGNGTVRGNDTVDLVLEDKEGNKYVALVTGSIFKMVAAAIKPAI